LLLPGTFVRKLPNDFGQEFPIFRTMKTFNLLLIDRSHAVLQELLQQDGRFNLVEGYSFSRERILEAIPAFQGVVLRSRISLDRDFFAQARQLQFVAREGIGLEHIDLQAAAAQGVEVINSPEGSRDIVGEHALGMLLSLLNRIHIADREVRAGLWNREANRGTEIKGKTVGIIGYGNTGQSFARRISGFEARVIAYDKYRENYGDAFAEAVDLSQLQQESDIVSMHIPYDSHNHYFVDQAFFEAFKKPIYFINTSRGLVTNTAALVAAMRAGKVLGAGLDVIEYEDSSFEVMREHADIPEPLQYLRGSDRTVMTPHVAGWSFESKRKHGEVLAHKIIQHINSLHE
jgi:D-3-phosphoglycerate dehydrogenase